MNNSLLERFKSERNNEFYAKNFLITVLLMSALHVLLALWMIQAFNKNIPLLNHSSASNTKSISIRFLSTPIQVSATSTEKIIDHFKPTEQPKSQLIAGLFGKKETTKEKIEKQTDSDKEKTNVAKKTDSSLSKESANIQHSKSTHEITENSKPQEVQEKPTNTSSVGSTTLNQSTNNSSQQTNTASTELVEKTKTKISEFKALNRRLNYPNRARSLGVEGRIRVQFDITSSGTISNIQVLSETPAGVFTDSVLKDMARWRYQTTGEVENQIVSIVFKLDGRVVLDN